MKKIAAILLTATLPLIAQAQQPDTSAAAPDTSKLNLNSGAIYNRPFITLGKTSTAVGGYVEGNTNYFATDGVSEGFSMELRRFNIFLYSAIARRIKFLSEIEFEHGVEEINVETALIDFEVDPAFNLRMGILLAPIGGFNQNHDSPRWEFIDRPLVSTRIIPSTLSEAGFGVHGRFYGHNKVFSYEAYLVNGLRDGIIQNTEGRTLLAAGKDPEMFGEDNNGMPMFTGKLGFRHRKLGEAGLSYYGGVYNSFRAEGVPVAPKRFLHLAAFDFNTSFGRVTINGEAAYAMIDVPVSAGEFFGSQQYGAFLEGVCTIMRRRVLRYENTAFNACLRLETVDYNVGTLSSSNTPRYDEIKAIVAGLSLRPAPGTVLRFNYRYHWERDLLGNPVIRTAGFQVGVASYF